MKRVKVSPGRFVTVSTVVAEKAARVFATGAFTPTQVREMAAAEPKLSGSGFLIGKPRSGVGRTTVSNTAKRIASGEVVVHGRDGRIVSGKDSRTGSGKRKAA
jgi:hypothetical protein